jgi:hypothetical protein
VAAVLAVAAAAAALIGFGQRGNHGPGAAAPPRVPGVRGQLNASAAGGGLVVVTMRGHVTAARTVHSSGGPAHYRETATFRVVWRLPASAFRSGRTFASASAIVTGTTSATFDNAPAKSCHGTLTVRRQRFRLHVRRGYDPLFASLTSSTTGVSTSPNPIATAVSAACPRGLFAGRWRLTAQRSAPWSKVVSAQRRRDWWVYNHPGGGFYGRNFTPLPKGGDGEGWSQGWGPAGSFTWLALFTITRTRRTTHAPTYPAELQTLYAPIPGLFLEAVNPCINNQLAACRRRDNAVRNAVRDLERALKSARVPLALARGDRELRRGLAALDAALALRIRLAHQATLGSFINADSTIIRALNLMDKAAADLNREDPHLHLRPV